MTLDPPPHVDNASFPFSTIAARFGALPGVAAVALGGSRTGGEADARSDVDLYVYATAEIPLGARAEIAGPGASRLVLDHRFWEPGDTWVDTASGIEVDVMYRTPVWIEDELERVLARHEASVGYSTALWHNALASVPLHDPEGWFAGLQARANRPYPEPLRRAIVAKNHPILRDVSFSYLRQIELAVARGDSVSVQHRLAALLASYFDVLFAINRLPHPGEKRLVQHAQARCALVPPGMARRLDDVLTLAPAAPKAAGLLVPAIRRLLDGLDALLAEEGPRPTEGESARQA